MQKAINIIKISSISLWALLAMIMMGSWIFHIVIYLIDGSLDKMFSLTNLIYFLVALVISMPLFYSLKKKGLFKV